MKTRTMTENAFFMADDQTALGFHFDRETRKNPQNTRERPRLDTKVENQNKKCKSRRHHFLIEKAQVLSSDRPSPMDVPYGKFKSHLAAKILDGGIVSYLWNTSFLSFSTEKSHFQTRQN